MAMCDFNAAEAVIKQKRMAEKAAGKELLFNILESHGMNNAVLKYEVTGKPYVALGSDILNVSLSHTPGKIIAAVCEHHKIGIDIERKNRRVSPKLSTRIRHENETTQLCEELTAIQIWSAKESVLKCKGTGLRHAMNKLEITSISDNVLAISDGSDCFEVCMSEIDNYVIAVAVYKMK